MTSAHTRLALDKRIDELRAKANDAANWSALYRLAANEAISIIDALLAEHRAVLEERDALRRYGERLLEGLDAQQKWQNGKLYAPQSPFGDYVDDFRKALPTPPAQKEADSHE